jgi:peroxiredoxin Q/BCP
MPDDGALEVGAAAPAISATLVTPEKTRVQRALADLYTDKPLLLNFYTADFSPDCVTEWCSFRDFEWFAVEDTVRVVGASRSGPGLHERFIDYLGLNFPLYSDPDLEMAAAFGVKYRALGISARSRRSSFLIDTDGTIRYRWLGEHWLDPTRDVPPVEEIYEDIKDILAES